MPLIPKVKVYVLAAALCFCGASGGSQRSVPLQVGIRAIKATAFARVELELSSFSLVLVPMCRAAGGEAVLCTAATQLQVRAHGVWKAVKLRRLSGVLGAVPLSRAEALATFRRKIPELSPVFLIRLD